MGFQTPLYELSEYLGWTTSGKIQLPDFQRGYKWEDERIRSLLVTVLRGHPLGVVMLLKTGNDQVRFKPKPIQGVELEVGVEPQMLLLDGQQRLTSLTQALTGDGIVSTKDGRGKKLTRKYYVDISVALEGEDRLDDAVRSLPADGVVRTNFGKDVEFDVSTPGKEREHGYFPVSLLFSSEAFSWLMELPDAQRAKAFNSTVIKPTGTYNIPAIELDTETGKSAHIFESKFLPYPKQIVPLAAIKAVMGQDADLLGPSKALVRWFWCGIVGELYGGAIETRFVRDLEQVPHGQRRATKQKSRGRSKTLPSSSRACTPCALETPPPTRASTRSCLLTRRVTGWRTRHSTWFSTQPSRPTSTTSFHDGGAMPTR